MFPRLSSSRRMRSAAAFPISTMVSTNDPNAMVPKDGPSAFLSESPTSPRNSVVPAGAKYHWHIVPPMTYRRVSSANDATHMKLTVASAV